MVWCDKWHSCNQNIMPRRCGGVAPPHVEGTIDTSPPNSASAAVTAVEHSSFGLELHAGAWNGRECMAWQCEEIVLLEPEMIWNTPCKDQSHLHMRQVASIPMEIYRAAVMKVYIHIWCGLVWFGMVWYGLVWNMVFFSDPKCEDWYRLFHLAFS